MRPIPSAPGYFADDNGDIWRNGTKRVIMDNGRGYKRIKLSIRNKQIDGYVHRLVCEAYHGPCPDGRQCRHLDGVRDNNKPGNLQWATKAENEADKVTHGTLVHGERVVTSVLTEAMVIECRRRREAGETVTHIAASIGVNTHPCRCNRWPEMEETRRGGKNPARGNQIAGSWRPIH